jgi:hypothetical protein
LSAPTPLFLLSLPRSGSTLLQRILAAHPEVATAAEPWVLLPPLYARRTVGVRAEYSHRDLAMAVTGLVEAMPGGEADYHRAVAAFAAAVYGALSTDGTRYFLDKTPRYHLVCEELAAAFPTARFLLLWRDPLAVVASMVETWHRGKWYLHDHRIDLFEGVDRLCRLAGRDDIDLHAVDYEALVSDPERVAADICGWLGLEPSAGLLAGAAAVGTTAADDDVPGAGAVPRLGDRVGTTAYDGVSTEPLEKWRTTLASPVRRSWCRRWIDWIGPERLELMGYDPEELHRRLRGLGTRPRLLPGDLLRALRAGWLAAREGYPLR